MPALPLTLQILRCEFDEFVYLRPLGPREVSRLGAREDKARRVLLDELQLLWRDPQNVAALGLYRAALPDPITALVLEIVLAPPKTRSAASLLRADWISPVTLTLDAFQWQESPDRCHGAIPALGLHILSETPEAMSAQLVQNAQLWLTRKSARVGLMRLAQLARLRFSIAEPAHLALDLLSAKQRDQAKDKPLAKSVLADAAQDLSLAKVPGWCLDADLAKLAELLSGASARSVLLVGPAGCGKTTLVCALAKRKQDFGMLEHSLWQTSGARLVAGQSGFGMWQKRCQELCRELAKAKTTILHLGQLHELMQVGKTHAGEQSIAGFLRREIAQGTITVLAECTPEQLLAIERAEPGLVAAFHVHMIAAPDSARSDAILTADCAHLLGDARAGASAAALNWLARLHRRYASYAAQPARALRFLRALCSTLAADTHLSVAEVTQAFQRESGLPALLLDDAQTFVRSDVIQFFSARVLGQDKAVSAVVDRIAQIKAQLHRPGKPLASLLMIGPTGTGKTEIAKALAEFLFSSSTRLTRFDLSQASDAGAVQRLIGSAAFGSSEGLLTAKIREQPFSVLLLDEFEKAHPSFFDLLLQLLGEGRLSDGSGRVADFSNAVVLLTSNLGAQQASRASIGFGSNTASAQQHFEAALQSFVRPELYNRFDAIIPFAALSAAHIHAIAEREVQRLNAREGLRTRGVQLSASKAAIALLSDQGFDPNYGARALKRSVEKLLVLPLAQALSMTSRSEMQSTQTLTWLIDANAGQLHINPAPNNTSAKLDASTQLPIQRVQLLRGKLEALQCSDRKNSLADELTLLNVRMRRAQKKRQQPDPLDLKRESSIAAPLAELAALREQTFALEDRLSAEYWQQIDSVYGQNQDEAAAALAPQLAALEQRLNALKRVIFRVGFRQPDTLRFAVCSEHASWLQELLLAYRAICLAQAGSLEIISVIERVASASGKPSNASPRMLEVAKFEKPERIFTSQLAHVLGVVLELRGDLFGPLFAGEFGLHFYKPVKEQGLERVALVEPAGVHYQARSELAKAGALTSITAPRRRAFQVEKQELFDSQSEPSRAPWRLAPVQLEISTLARAALARAIDQIDQSQAADQSSGQSAGQG